MTYILSLIGEIIDRTNAKDLEEATSFFMRRKQMTKKQFDEMGFVVKEEKPKIR